jgi:hypothetical protein
MLKSCFLIQPLFLYFLAGELRSLTFSVNIESYVVFPVILLFLCCLFLSYPSFANILI